MAKESNIPPFGEKEFGSFNPFKQFKFSGIGMETLLASYQKNMKLMNETKQIATETTQSVMDLQRRYTKKVFDQWNEQVKCCCSRSPLEEKTSRCAEATRATFDQAIEHTRELSDVLVKSNQKIMNSVQTRFKEGLDTSLNMAKKKDE